MDDPPATTSADDDSIRRIRAERLADVIAADSGAAGAGHMVRVNHLDRDEARRVGDALRRLVHAAGSLHVALLVGQGGGHHETTMTTDRAVEFRNRKAGSLCLFVPANLVDAAASSLGNSFAEINGEDLYGRLLA